MRAPPAEGGASTTNGSMYLEGCAVASDDTLIDSAGEYGPDALPLLVTALDAILGEVDSARDAYRTSKDQIGAFHPPSTANRPHGQPR